MRRPVLGIFSVFTRALSKPALEYAYEVLRKGMRAVDRLHSFRRVRVSIGTIEAVPHDFGGALRGRKIWHVHAHVLLDLGDGDLDEASVRSDFQRVTRRRNSFFGIQEIRADERIERYLVKARDMCPEPGTRTLAELDQLIQVFKGKELVVSSGIDRRGGRRATPMRTSPVKSVRNLASMAKPEEIDDTDIIDGPGQRQYPARAWRIRVRRSRLSFGLRRFLSPPHEVASTVG